MTMKPITPFLLIAALTACEQSETPQPARCQRWKNWLQISNA